MNEKRAIEVTVLVCGAAVMVLELVGSRILAPYLGTSMIVWTSLMGVILGFLSWGYHYGGELADKKVSVEGLAKIIGAGGVAVAVTAVINPSLLAWMESLTANLPLKAVVETVILLGPASGIMGMVSPYAARLRMKKLDTSGATVGNLYAISTLGSIGGTFLAGFVLISYLGTMRILWLIALVLGLNAAFLVGTKKVWILVAAGVAVAIVSSQIKQTFVDKDTAYNRVWIYKVMDNNMGREVEVMRINNETSSVRYADTHEMVPGYEQFYGLDTYFVPQIKRTLMIGGGGFLYPGLFLNTRKGATMDVVEIDPGVTDLARTYFGWKDNSRVSIYAEDGRTFLNHTGGNYDVIYGDAFKSRLPPINLTTREAVLRMYGALNSNGVVMVNVVSAVLGNKGQLARAEYWTFKSVFPQVYVFAVKDKTLGYGVQNLILVAMKSEARPVWSSSDAGVTDLLSHRWTGEIPHDLPVLTDDYAPLERYTMSLL